MVDKKCFALTFKLVSLVMDAKTPSSLCNYVENNSVTHLSYFMSYARGKKRLIITSSAREEKAEA